MQVILHLNYKNKAYESYVQKAPYYFLPVNGKPILLHTLLHLTNQIKVDQFLFILHRDVCNVDQVEQLLRDIMKEVTVDFRIVVSKEMNSPLYIEEHLAEKGPLMFMEPTIQYKYINEYIRASSKYDGSQLYVNEEEVAMIYFHSKKEYQQFGDEMLNILHYTDEEASNLIWFNTPKKYIQFVNQQDIITTVIEDFYTHSISETCKVMLKILDKGVGFRLDYFSIAIILEGSCSAIGDEIQCGPDTILAGEGVFIANEYSKVFFLEDQSIIDKKPYCALIDQKKAFPNGVIISDTPPSMLPTHDYELHSIACEAETKQRIQHTETRDLYILYEGELYLNERNLSKDIVVEIPKGQTFIKQCISPCKYVLIRIKGNTQKDTHGATEGLRQLSV